MIESLFLLLTLTLAAAPAEEQETAESFVAVSYVEVEASSRGAAIARFRTYEAAAPASLRFELFEEVSQAGHFAVVETWPDEAAFEAGEEASQALRDALRSIRVSDYDQRPYRRLDAQDGLSGAGLYVIAHVDVSPSPEVPALLRQQARESRQEGGNLRFDVLQHTMRANHFTVIEGWDTMAEYRSHVEAGHTRSFRDALGPYLGSPLDQRLYRAVD